jgi:hypothetical protein
LLKVALKHQKSNQSNPPNLYSSITITVQIHDCFASFVQEMFGLKYNCSWYSSL